MKKKVLLITIISAILLLVGGAQIGRALATPDSKPMIAASYPKVNVPDYPADGKLFSEMYQKNTPFELHREAPDYRLDAEFYNDWYRIVSDGTQNQWVPDYPLDAQVFVDHYTASP
jgi:hypothetical protein